MKKVMIGILILIPVLILVIVAAISNFLKIAAWIAVDDITVVYKGTTQEAESIDIEFSGTKVEGNFDDFVSVKVMPDYANRYSIEWRISDVEFMDERYQQEYEKYEKELEEYNRYLSNLGNYNNQIKNLETQSADDESQLAKDIAEVQASSLSSVAKREKIEELQEAFNERQAEREREIEELTAKKNALVMPDVRYVAHAAMLVDDNGNEVTSNTSSKFVINSYCRFNLTIQVENVSRTLSVIVKGYNVDHIVIENVAGEDNTMRVGEKMLVNAKYTPASSIVTETRWHSDNPSVATIDSNGVITALSAGVANITVEANRYDDKTEFVTSEVYTVTVGEGVSKFGSEFSTSKNPFTLNDIGVAFDDIIEYEGCTIESPIAGGFVALTDDVAKIVTKNGTITINKCDDNDIVIENADIYSATAGYVFEVSELTLKLRAVWADVLKEGVPDDVVWESSDAKIVTVAENGEVTAIESGLVDITASKDGKTSKLMLNVQIKLASMKLRTGNAYYAVGLARETVFAAEKYKFENSTSTDKVANSVLIEIIDAPKRADFASESEYIKQLATFYFAYEYEIVEVSKIVDGEKVVLTGEFAYFSNNSGEPNRLIFIPSAIEGHGKITITVKVSAKYPKYESDAGLTSEEVNINVIYGVEVNNIAEFRKASEEQKTYAYADGNLQQREIGWEHVNTENGKNDVYRYYEAEYSLRMYGISVMSDLRFEDEVNPDGTLVEIRDSNNVKIYGDVYGNNHLLSAARNQVYDVQAMLWIAWSNVTVSNLTIRANKMDKDGTLSSDETNGLKGECLEVFTENDYAKNRISGVRIEFCILENARRAGQSYNADFTMDGVVVRNIDSCAFYIPARMTTYDEEGVSVTYPDFSRVTMNNCVYANCISTIGSYSYERFTVVANKSDGRMYDGRFITDDIAANAEYFMEHFYSAGVNTQIRQTGFIDIYNWQNVSVANIIDTGDSETNKLIGLFAGDIFRYADEFGKCRYIDENNECYIHMGILTTGISFGEGIMDEPIYLDATFEDSRMASEPINTRKLPSSVPNLSPAAAAALPVIRAMEIRFYGYDVAKLGKNDIWPNSTFELNSNFIARLHGEVL